MFIATYDSSSQRDTVREQETPVSKLPSSEKNPVATVAYKPRMLFLPIEWLQYERTVGSYRKTLVDSKTFSLQATATYNVSDKNSENEEDWGDSLNSVLVFWVRNGARNNAKIKKLTLYVFSETGKLLLGREILPPNEQSWIGFSSGEAHVLPVVTEGTEELPAQIAVLVEDEKTYKHVFVILGLKEMIKNRWRNFCSQLSGKTCNVKSRIIQKNIDNEQTGELFAYRDELNRFHLDDVRYHDGYGDIGVFDNKNPVTYFRIESMNRQTLDAVATSKLLDTSITAKNPATGN